MWQIVPNKRVARRRRPSARPSQLHAVLVMTVGMATSCMIASVLSAIVGNFNLLHDLLVHSY